MPNRVVREGLIDSDKVDKLTAEEERFYTRLLLVVDDYGCFDARPTFLKSKCFPIKEGIKTKDVESWLERCVGVELVLVYGSEEKPYLYIYNYRQRLRQMRRKYPAPPEALLIDSNSLTPDSNTPPESETESEEKIRIDENIEIIYSHYPVKCPINGSATGKSAKCKDKIRRHLKKNTVDELLELQEKYLSDCITNNRFIKNYTTFLNNLPDPEQFKSEKEIRFELVESIKEERERLSHVDTTTLLSKIKDNLGMNIRNPIKWYKKANIGKLRMMLNFLKKYGG